MMEWKMNPNAVNQFSKGSTIYTQGDPVFSVGMIIKGRVMIHNKGAKIVVGSGSFLGINDLYQGKYLSSYTAVDDLLLYVYPIDKLEELDTILSVNKDYHGFMVASFYKVIYELDQIYHGMIKSRATLYQFLTEYYNKYLSMAKRKGIKTSDSHRISKLEFMDSDLELLMDRINYYIECKSLPIDAVKTFYSYGNAITLYQIEDQVNVVNQQIEALKEMSEDFVTMAGCLVDDTETCLFHLIAELSISMDNSSGTSNEIMEMMDDIIEQVNQAEIFAERMLSLRIKVNRKKMEEVYHLLLTNNKEESVSSASKLKYSGEDTTDAMEEMKDSFAKILKYAGFDGDRADEMQTAMQDFAHMKDKFSSDDHARKLRKRLSENHYEIYLPVFLRAHQEKNPPRLIDLFLKYGFADERLLTNDQMLSLYFLKDEDANQGLCKVYNIKSWLTMIYEGKKEPSKNEFDLEYPEHLAGLRKQNQLTEKEVVQHLADPLKKLQYEIQNMFRYNNRTTNGQISSFIPFLHKDQWSNGIDRLLLTSEKVNEVIAHIMRVDYSVFDRQIIYSNKNIVKEYIMKRVFPDVILLPNVGSNGIMWQEISGKKRDTSARFLLPIFTDINLELLLIRILGKFRWELCRTIEGISWNDIQVKSLTSEYGDYLQFYRKNKELSEEKKEKLKAQIQKGRNSSREIFVIDYEIWINYEAMGAIKLNKPVRELMATYCPFAKEIREQIKMQPLFDEAMARYYREKQKKVREIEGRLRLIQKENFEIPQELSETLVYHRDL
jgi:CRP-like cAMP-binding protein